MPDAFDVSDFLPYLLNQAAEVTSRSFQETYRARYGMRRGEWRVLFHLGQYGEMTASEIARRAMMDKVPISRAVQALEAKAFLSRAPNAEDRRAENLRLTKTGRAAFEDLRAAAEDYDRTLAALLKDQGPDDLKAALRALMAL